MFVATSEQQEDGKRIVDVWELVPNATQKRKVFEWMKETQERNNLAFRYKNHWRPTTGDLEASLCPPSETKMEI